MKRKIALVFLWLTAICCAFLFSACSGTKSLTIYVDGQVYETVEFSGTDFLDLPQLAERYGYEFKGWQLENGEYIFDGRINAIQVGESKSITAVWVPIDYYIYYDCQGLGSVDNAVGHYVISNTEISIPNAYCNMGGYYFEGWLVNGGTTPVLDYVIEPGQTGDINLVASWVRRGDIQYSVELYYEYESGYQKEKTTYHSGVFGENITINPEDYLLHSWDIEGRELDSSMSILSGVVPTELEPMMVLKVYYSLKRLNVTYDFNGGEYGVSTQYKTTVKYRVQLGYVPKPEKEGYNFVGYRDQNGEFYGVDAIKYLSLTTDTYFTAEYLPRNDIKYRVEIYKENYDGTFSLVKYNLEEGITGASVTLDDEYIFANCSISAPNHQFNKSISILSGTIAPDNSLRLKLYYTLVDVSATFYSNGGVFADGSTSITINLKKGQKLTFPEVTRQGWKFDWWKTESGSLIEEGQFSSYYLLENLRLTACWREDFTTYTVKYFYQNLDGKYELRKTQIENGKTNALISYDSPAEITEHMEIDTTLTTPRTTKIKADGSTVVEVYCSLKKYAITFLGQGGVTSDGKTKVDILVRYGANFVEQYPQFTREHYIFTGWNCEVQQPVLQAQTISANWQANNYAINYNLNGGENYINNPEYLTAGYTEVLLNDAKKTGYQFLGWTVEGFEGEPTKLLNIASFGYKEHTVVAHFRLVTYTITYTPTNINFTNPNPTSYTVEDQNIPLIPITEYDMGYTFKGFTYNGGAITQINTSLARNLTIVCDFREYTLGDIQLDSVQKFNNGYFFKGYLFEKYLFDATIDFAPEILNPTCIDSEGNEIAVSIVYPDNWSWPNNADSVTFVATNRGKTVQKKIDIRPLGNTQISINDYCDDIDLSLYEVQNYSGVTFYGSCLGIDYDYDVTSFLMAQVINVEYYFRPNYDATEYVKVDSVDRSGLYKYVLTFKNLAGVETVYEREYRVLGQDGIIITYDKDITDVTTGLMQYYASRIVNLTAKDIFDRDLKITAEAYSGEYAAGKECRIKYTILSVDTKNDAPIIKYEGYKTEIITQQLKVYGKPTINVLNQGLLVYNEDYTTYFEAFDSFDNPLEITYKLTNNYELYCYEKITATVTDKAGNTNSISKSGYVSYKEFECYEAGRIIKYLGSSDTVIFPDGASYICSDNGPIFDNPTSIKKIVVPNSVRQFSIGVFKDCTALEELSIPFIGSVRHDYGSYLVGTKGGSFFNIFSHGVADKVAGLNSIPETLKKLSITKTLNLYLSNNTYGLGGYLKNIETLIINVDDTSSLNSLDGSNKLKNVIVNVSTLNKNVFKDCTALTFVELNEGLLYIEDYAFSNCTSLERIVIPSTVTKIGAYAFSGCTNLKEVVISGDSLTTLGEYAFKDCVSLTQIPNLGSVTMVYNAFAGCLGLPSKLTIPSGLVSAEGLFDGMTQITEITFKEGTTEVSNVYKMFTNMPQDWRLQKVVIPSSVSIINAKAFKGMPIVSVTFEGAIDQIAGNAFQECIYLTEVNYKGGVRVIGASAFAGCVSLVSQNLETAEFIGQRAYYDCTALEQVILGDGIDTIYVGVFENCTSLSHIDLPNTVTNIYEFAFMNSNLQSITLPNALQSMGWQAFGNCMGLTTVSIPSSLTSASTVFSGCTNLKEIIFEPRESINSIVYALVIDTSVERIVLPNGLVEIGDRAFSSVINLSEIVIPSTVTKIGSYAFEYCTSKIVWDNPTITSLHTYAFNNYQGQTLEMPKSLKTIGYDEIISSVCSVFDGCSATIVWGESQVVGIGQNAFSRYLGTQITIPNTVVKIGRGAFKNSVNLQSITISGNTIVEEDAFLGCTSLTNLIIGEGLTIIDSTYTKNFSNLKSITLPASLQEIGENAFYNSKIEQVHIGQNSNLQTIGKFAFQNSKLVNFEIDSMASGVCTVANEKAFYQCTSLVSVLLPRPTVYGDYCFAYCEKLENVTITNQLTSLGIYCLRNTAISSFSLNSVASLSEGLLYCCDNLQSVELGEGVTSIGRYAFALSDALTSVSLPSTLTEISPNAFEGCTGLGSIEIPGSVSVLYPYVFSGCTGLTSVKLNNGLVAINGYAFNETTSLLTLEIPSTVTSLAEDTFAGCYAQISWIEPTLKTVVGFNNYKGEKIIIPSSATYIKGEAFANTSAEIDWGHSKVTMFYKKAFYLYKGESIFVPTTIDYIGETPFYGYTGKVYWPEDSQYEVVEKDDFSGFKGEVFLPNSIRAINEYGFRSCSGKINWIGTPAITEFVRGAFNNFSGELVIPSSIVKFNYSTFDYCSAKKVYASSLEQWLSIDFVGTSAHPAYTGCEILVGDKHLNEYDLSADGLVIGRYAFYKQNFTSLTLGDNAVVGAGAFSENVNLVTLKVGDNVELNDIAFMNCTSLASVEFEDSVSILGSVFNGCISLSKVDLPTDYIGEGAFYGCSLLSEVSYIHSSSLYIGAGAFANCPLITSMNLVGATIEEYAFSGCTGLVELDLTNASIGVYAFENCTNLRKVNLSGVLKFCEDSTEFYESPIFSGCTLKTVMLDAMTNIVEKDIDGQSVEEIFVTVELDYYLIEPEAKLWIDISVGNMSNENTKVYYYSKNQPTNTEYACWHYNASGEIELW